MTNISPIHQHQTSCCHGIHSPHLAKKQSMMDKLLRVLEKVSLVAVAVFSAMTSFGLFASSFAAGFVIGLWSGRELNAEPNDHNHSLCAHGFLEHLTGVRLPAPLALGANVAILVAHIDHHAPVFVPIVGLTYGIWTGREAAPAMELCYKKVVSFADEHSSFFRKMHMQAT